MHGTTVEQVERGVSHRAHARVMKVHMKRDPPITADDGVEAPALRERSKKRHAPTATGGHVRLFSI